MEKLTFFHDDVIGCRGDRARRPDFLFGVPGETSSPRWLGHHECGLPRQITEGLRESVFLILQGLYPRFLLGAIRFRQDIRRTDPAKAVAMEPSRAPRSAEHNLIPISQEALKDASVPVSGLPIPDSPGSLLQRDADVGG